MAKKDEIMDYFAIGQVTPGIIAVNTSTFVGHKTKGIIGGIVATAGMVFPSIIIIKVIAAFLKNFANYKPVQYAFNGVRACVCVLIFEAVRKMTGTEDAGHPDGLLAAGCRHGLRLCRGHGRDLRIHAGAPGGPTGPGAGTGRATQIGRASCRERV